MKRNIEYRMSPLHGWRPLYSSLYRSSTEETLAYLRARWPKYEFRVVGQTPAKVLAI